MSNPDGGGGSGPKTPLLVLTPYGPVNLGNVGIGQTASVVFTISNQGQNNSPVSSVTALGSAWSLSGLPALPISLAPGDSVQFTLTFTPPSVGAATTTVVVNPDLYCIVNATGVTAGNGAFTPAVLAFPPTQVNTISNLNLTLTNVGGAFKVLSYTFASCIALPIFDGTGLNDMTDLGGVYTGTPNSGLQTYTVTIDGTNGVGLATLAVGGSGYSVNDTGTIATGSTVATYKVTAVSSGHVTAFIVTKAGAGYSLSNGVATAATTGGGAGLTVNLIGLVDTFSWQLNAGALTSGVAITGVPQVLSQGVQVQFGQQIGHNLSDEWVVVVTPTTGTEFELINPPATPISLAPAGTQLFLVGFDPTTVGYLTDTLYLLTDLAGTLSCPLSGVCVLIVPVAVNFNNDQELVVGGYDLLGLSGTPSPLVSLANNYNSEQAGSLIFNGALWEQPGMEKSLFRLGFYYENLGVCTLTGTLTVFRPQQGADNVQEVDFTISLGTAAADGTTRYAEVDAIATGEIITLSLFRAASSGPVSICLILPYFEQRGEKVPGV